MVTHETQQPRNNRATTARRRGGIFGRYLAARLEVQPRQDDGLNDIVESVRQQLCVQAADAAADYFDVDGRRQGEISGDDDGAWRRKGEGGGGDLKLNWKPRAMGCTALVLLRGRFTRCVVGEGESCGKR